MEYVMDSILRKKNKVLFFIKESVISLFIIIVLVSMDRCLENMYCFFLYDTGKRYLDIFMSLYLHAHRWLTFIVPLMFIVWCIIHKFKVNFGLLLPISVVYVLYLITSLLTCGYTYRWSNTTLYPMVMYLFVTMVCSTERSAKRLFRVGTDLYIILLVLNAVFVFFPSLYDYFTGWRPDYFLSADNLTGFPMLCGLFLALLDYHYSDNKVRLIIYIMLFILNQALIHCASSLIATLCVGICFIPSFRKKYLHRDLKVFVLISVGFSVLLVFSAWLNFHSQTAFDFFDPIIDLRESMFVRFIIWNGVLLLCLKKPLFGYGLGMKAEFFLRPDTDLEYNAHNAYLQTLYEGGIFTLGAVIFTFLVLSKKMKRCKDTKLTDYITAVIFAELIMMQASITSWFTWYPVLLIAQIGVLCCLQEEVKK